MQKIKKNNILLHFFGIKFAYVNKKLYLCSVIQYKC